MSKLWIWLSGKKTYICAAATLLYALAEWWSGQISQSAAIAMILGAGGLGSLRHGLASELGQTLVGVALDSAKKTAPVFACMLPALLLLTALSACGSSTQSQIHANVQQFQSNLNADVNSALPTIQTVTCLDAKGAAIAAPVLSATGNANAGNASAAASQTAVAIACPPGSVPSTAAPVAKPVQ